MGFVQFLYPPQFSDPEKTRVARIMHVFLLSGLIVLLLSFATLFIVETLLDDLLIRLPVLAFLIVLFWLLRSGHVYKAGWIYVIGAWAICTVLAFLANNLFATSLLLVGYLIPILTAGFIFGKRAIIGMAILGGTFASLITLGKAYNMLPNILAVTSDEVFVIPLQLSILVYGTVTLYVAIDDIDSAMKRANDRENRLAQTVKQLASANQQLEREIKQRKTIEAQLTQATQIAQQANEAKTNFLAGMNHELRTPLSAIMGYGELLAELSMEKGDSWMAERLNKIVISAEFLHAIVDDVLDLSKIEARQMPVMSEPILLSDWLTKLLVSIEPLFKRNNNQLVTDFAPNIEIYTDNTKLSQIFLNLLNNATKFTQDGQVVFRAFCQGDVVVFKVQDTGIGMTEEQAQKIFKPFVQARSEISRQYGGTGLGLAITQQLCHLLGGNIAVESEEGVGTTFTVQLPMHVEEECETLPLST